MVSPISGYFLVSAALQAAPAAGAQASRTGHPSYGLSAEMLLQLLIKAGAVTCSFHHHAMNI